MSRIFEVITPEQVAIRYELAGFGSRALAALFDSFLQLLLLVLIEVVAALLMPGKIAEIESWEQFTSSAVAGVLLIAMFLVFWGYHIFFETFWNGETPGKRFMHLRVIKDGGHPVDFRAVVIRNLLRAVDVLPGFPALAPLYGIAMISVLSNNQYKRLGDLAAGTIVVRHGTEEDPDVPLGFGETTVYRLLDASVLSLISRMTREEHRLLQHFLDKRHTLTPSLRAEFARRLALPLMEKFTYQIPAMGVDYERWIDELDLAYRTRSLGPSPAPINLAPATPTPSVVASTVVADEDDDVRRW